LIALAFFGIWGSLRMQVETDFTKNFRASSQLVRGYQVVESQLGGAGVWDIMLPAPVNLTEDYLDSVLQLEEHLRQIQADNGSAALRLTKVLSIADANAAACTSSWLASLPLVTRLEGMRAAMPVFTQALLTPTSMTADVRWLRIMLRSHEQITAAQKDRLIELVTQKVAQFTTSEQWLRHFQQPPPAAEVTGYYVMLGRLVGSILSDQWKCFLLATLGILLIMTLATRSFYLALAALVPNALPVFLVLGAMGWCGLSVNMGAAMIAAVSMGLSIDSSIHYLLHMQRQMRLGRPAIKAMRSAQENVGLALVLATAALIAGFLSLCFSQFVPTIVFGVLVSLTMLGGLIGNLIVLPLLVAPRK
jgi:predicted RND superfamily exporter protein